MRKAFSRLKQKNELRTRVLQEKLASLNILCIETDKRCSLSFQDIVNDFAFEKSRKWKFSYLNEFIVQTPVILA
jgi:hypothetical protein